MNTFCEGCGNQLEKVFGHFYCHKCDIDDELLEEYHKDCECDYCKGRKQMELIQNGKGN